MKRSILTIFTALTFSLAMLAQAGGTAAASGKTSGKSKTATGAQTGASAETKEATAGGKAKGAGASSVLTGCLSGPNAENAYVLSNGRYKRGVEVGGNDELSKHVGHRVQLTGTWAKSGAAIGEKENEAAEKNEKGGKEAAERHFKVTAIKHLADSCTEPASGAAKAGPKSNEPIGPEGNGRDKVGKKKGGAKSSATPTTPPTQ
jgi:hypothetical protein